MESNRAYEILPDINTATMDQLAAPPVIALPGNGKKPRLPIKPGNWPSPPIPMGC